MELDPCLLERLMPGPEGAAGSGEAWRMTAQLESRKMHMRADLSPLLWLGASASARRSRPPPVRGCR